MTTPTIDIPDTTPAPSAPTGPRDRYVHLYCCDSSVALCGANPSRGIERPNHPAEAACPLCEVIDDLDEPCGITCRGAA
jgi:hypothetical protein